VCREVSFISEQKIAPKILRKNKVLWRRYSACLINNVNIYHDPGSWQAGESKRADRKRRRLYFYTRSAISRSAAHRETAETPLLLWCVLMVTSNFRIQISVCVYYCRTYYKAVRGGGRRRVEDMCYDRRRAEACVDESAHHALGPVRNPVL
jgi:hypothetical protein